MPIDVRQTAKYPGAFTGVRSCTIGYDDLATQTVVVTNSPSEPTFQTLL